jgi:2-polyprenyl-6-methoxyphenol hydroxylase-like FAD-dependent oxidoreductase
MKKLLLSLFIVLAGVVFTGLKAPVSVVIIGGGPAGLSTAIEARHSGARVTVVEKRSAYERTQRIFLFEHSLELLEKWEVESLELSKINMGEERIGIVRISALEEALLKRAQELGVFFIQEEFVGLSPQERSINLGRGVSLSYDILVAADGTHSQVRQELGIEVDLISQGKAGAALVPCLEDELSLIDVSPDIQHGASFIKKFYFPGMHFMFLQGPFSATQEDFITLCKASGWVPQAEQIAAGKARLLLDVDVYLQKAKSFSLQNQGALLVGDAAGTGTFFRGSGANHALKTAEIAGHFFRSNDFETFEAEMDKSTSALIEDSAFLFPKDQI